MSPFEIVVIKNEVKILKNKNLDERKLLHENPFNV